LLDDTHRQRCKTSRNVCTDGGFASQGNLNTALQAGLANVVFDKAVGSMQNVASSKWMATRLENWRLGIEANIPNLKQRSEIGKCDWQGWQGFQYKVLTLVDDGLQ